MKRTVDTFTPEEQDRVWSAFELETKRELPFCWLKNRAFGDFGNADAFDNHRDGVRVFREVELHDDGHLWLHVSVSLRGMTKVKPPGWYVMDAVKRVFVGDDRVAYQIHPKRTDHYSEREVLHLWCPLEHEPIGDMRHPEGRL